MSSCSCCDKPAQSHRLVGCCVCGKRFSIDCIDVSAAEARKINAKSGLFWSCKNCAVMAGELNSLRSIVLRLEAEISALKSSQAVAIHPGQSLLDSEAIVQEVSERERRKCNLMVYGYDEGDVSSKVERVEVDTLMVSDLFRDLGVEQYVPSVEPIRIGRYDPTRAKRSRPIKLCLPSESAVVSVLRKSPKLRTVERWSGVFVSRDRTPMQNRLYKTVKSDLNDRLAAGEVNLRIQYKGGIPTIVPAGPPQEN